MVEYIKAIWPQIHQEVGKINDRVEAGDRSLSDNDRQWIVMLAVLRHWTSCGRVVVSGTETLQTLLSVSATGHIDDVDLESPYGFHATWFDPPLRSRCIFVGCEVEHAVNFVIFGRKEGDTNFLGMIGYDDENVVNALAGDESVFNDEVLSDPSRASPLRVAIGLSRLIKSAPPADRSGVSHTDQVQIQDRGVSKKHGTRSVYVRNVFVVEPRVVEACRAALRGGPRAPCLRHLVRGHWRNQAVGKGRKERDLRWIQPFWKGVMRDVMPMVEVRVK